jgi:hypothetical protein
MDIGLKQRMVGASNLNLTTREQLLRPVRGVIVGIANNRRESDEVP